jgi:GxxExxY protein
MPNITKSYLTDLTYQVNGAAIEVHKFLGPGLLESVYHKCLKKELNLRGISFKSELLVPIIFKDLEIETDLRCDLFIENCIVLELKAIETILPIHHAQLMTYMKLLEAPKGILYNFHSVNLYKDGQKTFVNEYFRILED